MIYIGISVLYYFGNSKLERTSFYSIGALLTMILVILNSFLFSVYIDNFSQRTVQVPVQDAKTKQLLHMLAIQFKKIV